MTIRDYSTTPANNNAAPPNGWPEGQAASTVNDCARQMMAEIRESFEELPYFDYGDDPTRVDNDTFTLAGDLTARYPVGARVKLVGATTETARITVSSHAAGTTTIDVVMDSGNVPASLVRVAVQNSSGSSATPTSVSLSASAAGTAFDVSRADHVHALSQAIAPTWSELHTFTKSGGLGGALLISSAVPQMGLTETDAAANNKTWQFYAQAEQLVLGTINDANSASANIMTVDRTGTTVDRVTFPTVSGYAHLIGVAPVGPSANTPILAVNSNSASSAAQFENTSATAPVVYIGSDQTGGNVYVSFYDGGDPDTNTGTITTNGTTTAYNTTSDQRKKLNIADAPVALPTLIAIRVRQYDWVKDGSHSDHGLVAQELFEVCPYAVHVGGVEENWGVDHSKLVPLAIKGMQEMQAQVQALAARVSALEAVRVGAIGK